MGVQDEDLSLVRDQARRLIADMTAPERLKELLEEPGSFDRALWRQAIDMGWPAIAMAEEDGGLGLGWQGLALLAEELGRKTASIPLVAGAVALRAIIGSAVQGQLAEVVGELLSGERIACLAFCEAGEADIPAQPAVRLSAGRLSGRKAIAPFAAVADVALISACDDDGPTLVLVPLAQPGVSRVVAPSFDNARAAAALHFDGAEAVVLQSGATAVERIGELVALAAAATAFEQIGGAASCLELARGHAMERHAFGQPIARFQAIKHKLADMYWRLELARGAALEAIQAIDGGDPAWPALAAAARIGATEAYEFAARENIQTHGGLGVTWEAMPHHYYRRSRALAVELGSLVHWRDTLLGALGFDSNPVGSVA